MFNSIEESVKKGIDFLKSNQYFLLECVVLFFLFHGNEFFNFNISIDDEMHLQYQSGTKEWIGQGRWFMYVLNSLLLPVSVVPITTLFLYMVAVTIATLLQIRLWTGDHKIQLRYFLLLPFFLGIPTISSSIAFAFQTYAIGFGILIATISSIVFIKLDWKYVVISGALFSLSIGIYQGLILFTLPIIFVKLVRDDSFTFQNILKYGAHVLIAVLIHFLMAFLFRQLFQVESGYIQTFWNPELLFTKPQVALLKMFKMMGSYYSGLNVSFLNDGWLLGVIMVFALLSFGETILSRKKVFQSIIALGLMLLSPFLLTLMNGGALPERTLLSLPLVIGAVIYLGIFKLPKKYLIILGILIGIFTIKLSVINNGLSYAQQLIYQHDRELSIQIYDQLKDDPDFDPSKKYKLVMIGKYEPAIKSHYLFRGGNFRQSIYSWGHEKRIIDFMKVMGLKVFEQGAPSAKKTMKRRVKDLPAWPHPNALTILDEYVVLKFEDDKQRLNNE